MKQDKEFKTFQIVCRKSEARRIERYCQRKGVPVSRFFRDVAALVIDAAEAHARGAAAQR